MRSPVPAADRADALAYWRGSNAVVWMYHASLRRFAIQLARLGVDEVLYVVAVGCERVCGPLRWQNADIVIEGGAPEYGENVLWVRDAAAGFELKCSDVVAVTASILDPVSSFKGFLEEDDD